MTDAVNIAGAEEADADAVRDLREFLDANGITVNEQADEADTTFILGEADDEIPALEDAKDRLSMSGADGLGDEGYVLNVDRGDSAGGTIVIEGKDGDGTFYGVQTLRQLAEVRDGKTVIASAEITDEPTMSVRGTIEGFYGNPWSHEDRISQIEFYGDMKMNTYIYAPKDDPYHRSSGESPIPHLRWSACRSSLMCQRKIKSILSSPSHRGSTSSLTAMPERVTIRRWWKNVSPCTTWECAALRSSLTISVTRTE